ncbi:MAG: type II toxin-antitoxin system HipA family toxin YjjJ [Gammaproteobacteria bacterium]|nr:type II toxin-antitoxin system HipA family toxin YjjJ [Gammaproteobacteria bacterium]MCP5136479.1 type II toxin-antitoxin system HipA family toxin YjjJ [Gammaproteobacteria bacterium]
MGCHVAVTLQERLGQGLATSSELQNATGLSQTTVARQLRELGDAIVRIQHGRTVHYGLTHHAFGAANAIPLHRVDAYGNHVLVATIFPLVHGGFFVTPTTGTPAVLAGVNRDGLFEDLPYFLDDLRPQGFLGRQIAHELAARDGRFPNDPAQWTTDHVGRYLVANGDDLPGDLILGEQIHLRLRRPPTPITEADYPRLAESVLAGEIPGSSAGGEQAKFTAYRADRGHVIVKFSPKGDEPVARRWRDVLITEHHAAETMDSFGFPAAQTRLFADGGRVFLESARFDRHGAQGRLPMISLRAVDAEFTGLGSDWPRVMQALAERNLVSQEHATDALAMWAFGRLIHNTDMHLGNLSLAMDGHVFRLLPAYDMCSMGFAPRANEVRPPSFARPEFAALRLPDSVRAWPQKLACRFWRAVGDDPRISAEFREFIADERLADEAIWVVSDEVGQ